MGDPLKKVQAGQRLEIPADAYNAFVDAARAERSRRHDVAQDAHGESRQTGIVRVRNIRARIWIATASWHCVTRSSVPPTTSRNSRTGSASMAKHPRSARRERFAILLDPLAAADRPRIVAGVTPVRVNVVRETDVAEFVADDHTSAKLTIRPDTHPVEGSRPGVKWAVCV